MLRKKKKKQNKEKKMKNINFNVLTDNAGIATYGRLILILSIPAIVLFDVNTRWEEIGARI